MDPVKLHDVSVSGTDLVVGHRDQVYSSSIVRSKVSSSRIELVGKGDRTLTTIDSSFDQCDVTGRKAFGYFLHSASWTNCTFHGKFTDCVFGFDPEGQPAVINKCDFFDADLHIVAFRGGLDYESCRFRAWPTVLFARHQLDLATLSQRGLPPDLLTMLSIRSARDDQWLALDVKKYDPCDFDVYCMLRGQAGVHFHGASFPVEPTTEETEAASSKYLEQMRRHKLYRFWMWISQAVSLTHIELGRGECVLTLRSAKNPPIDLPDTFRVRLLGLESVDLGCAGFLTEDGNKKSFRLMGASIADDFSSVVLKGHRKTLGVIRLTYESMSIQRCDGDDEPIQSLADWSGS